LLFGHLGDYLDSDQAETNQYGSIQIRKHNTVLQHELSSNLVLMLGDHHTGQRTGEVSLQVREYDRSIIAGGQQVVRARREAHAAHLTAVNLKKN